MQQLNKLATIAALTGALAGCNNVTYRDPSTIPSGVTHESTGHFFLAGLIGHADVWANHDCQRVAGVHSEFSFGDEVLALLTLGIYAPRTYTVECAR